MAGLTGLTFGRREFLAGSAALAVTPRLASAADSDPALAKRVDQFMATLADQKLNLLTYYVTRDLTNETFSSLMDVADSKTDVTSIRKSLSTWGDATEQLINRGLAKSSDQDVQELPKKQADMIAAMAKVPKQLNFAQSLMNGSFTATDPATVILHSYFGLLAPLTPTPDGPTFLDIVNKKPNAINAGLSDFVVDSSHPETQEQFTENVARLLPNKDFMNRFQKEIDLARQLKGLIHDGFTQGAANAFDVVADIQKNGQAQLANTKAAETQARKVLSPATGLGLPSPGATARPQPQ